MHIEVFKKYSLTDGNPAYIKASFNKWPDVLASTSRTCAFIVCCKVLVFTLIKAAKFLAAFIVSNISINFRKHLPAYIS
ncbi:hypothetical protein ACFFJY_16460 [Fictibacillus aquaticus]|uniref:Uncharacterized protein n=1 Tax=Fictibacillus aquaticus TaxID=2021314 RepID=A0A235F6H8_9BACL|nr:hypothetical protein [Fictibacillus aquaticus]OYD56901.1 hypothetical protein CGZ90_15210 [Fictibacillus aquaticus]